MAKHISLLLFHIWLYSVLQEEGTEAFIPSLCLMADPSLYSSQADPHPSLPPVLRMKAESCPCKQLVRNWHRFSSLEYSAYFLCISILISFLVKEIACIKCEAVVLPVRKGWSLIQMSVLVLFCVSVLGELGCNHERNLIHMCLSSQLTFNYLISPVAWCLILLNTTEKPQLYNFRYSVHWYYFRLS